MSEKSAERIIFYVGNHAAGEYLGHVPPRAISESEALACGHTLQELVDTNLYEWPGEPEINFGIKTKNDDETEPEIKNKTEIQPPAPPKVYPASQAMAQTPRANNANINTKR